MWKKWWTHKESSPASTVSLSSKESFSHSEIIVLVFCPSTSFFFFFGSVLPRSSASANLLYTTCSASYSRQSEQTNRSTFSTWKSWWFGWWRPKTELKEGWIFDLDCQKGRDKSGAHLCRFSCWTKCVSIMNLELIFCNKPKSNRKIPSALLSWGTGAMITSRLKE